MDDIRKALPREIVDLILCYMNTKTKRTIRSTNKYWFSYIRFDEFNIYFVNLKNISEITQHFSEQYPNTPIGINLWKAHECNIDAAPFMKLTQLTSVGLPEFYGSLQKKFINGLSALTNLQKIWPRASINATMLTNLTFLSCERVQNGQHQHLSLFNKLRHLDIQIEDYTGDILSLVANPSILTSLNAMVPHYDPSTSTANMLTQFNNLKKLSLQAEYAESVITSHIMLLTRLERLRLVNILIESELLDLTKLTYLAITFHKPIDLRVISRLTNLKFLEINLWGDTNYASLSALTNLEQFVTTSPQAAQHGLEYLNSQKLTQFNITTDKKAEFHHFSKFTSLLDLKVLERGTAPNYEGLVHLAKLTSLIITSPTLMPSQESTVLNSLAPLRKLSVFGSEGHCHEDLAFSNLTNLESVLLQCSLSENTYKSLHCLTSLTSLDVRLTGDVFLTDPMQLVNLKLRRLVFIQQLKFENWYIASSLWNLVTKLTDLEHLCVWHVTDEPTINSFLVLTNLTTLSLQRCRRVVGMNLTKLTNLQDLTFICKPARKYFTKKTDDFWLENFPYLIKKYFGAT